MEDLYIGCGIPSVAIWGDVWHLKDFGKRRCHHRFAEYQGMVHRLHLHGFNATHFLKELLLELLFQLIQIQVSILLQCWKGFSQRL